MQPVWALGRLISPSFTGSLILKHETLAPVVSGAKQIFTHSAKFIYFLNIVYLHVCGIPDGLILHFMLLFSMNISTHIHCYFSLKSQEIHFVTSDTRATTAATPPSLTCW